MNEDSLAEVVRAIDHLVENGYSLEMAKAAIEVGCNNDTYATMMNNIMLQVNHKLDKVNVAESIKEGVESAFSSFIERDYRPGELNFAGSITEGVNGAFLTALQWSGNNEDLHFGNCITEGTRLAFEEFGEED